MREIVNEAMGPHTQPVVGFLAVGMGPQPRDTPAQGHVDGGWSGLSPVSRSDILASGQTLETWDIGDPESMGPAGGAPFWHDPEGQLLAIGSFTAFCGVCLNDQRAPGKGQFAVQKGAHEAVEAFFRMQRDAGGPLGGGGPGWPRLVPAGEDGATAGQMPAAMVATYPDNTFEHEDWPWPHLTPALMEAGDGVIALHSIPHTATPNLSDDPRMNVYFRIRRLRPENPHEGDGSVADRAVNRKVAWGVSDHPDRAFSGEFLDFPEGYDPYGYSIEKLCDHWSEWDGMKHIVAEGRRAAARL